MPRTLNKLSDAHCRNTAPRSKPCCLFVGLGLYLEVAPSGSWYWRLKYRFAGREKRVALGMYPEVRLKEARELALRTRRQRESGLDPSTEKRRAIRTTEALAANTCARPIGAAEVRCQDRSAGTASLRCASCDQCCSIPQAGNPGQVPLRMS